MYALHRDPEAAGEGASRRELIVAAAATAAGGLAVGCSPAGMAGVMSIGAKSVESAFGPFIEIDPQGGVTVVSKHIEFGQGASNGLAAIVAEELGAAWDQVKVAFAPANAKVYANTLMGVQGTGGSTAINNSWDQLRQAGAGARAMFVQAAAEQWKVAPGEIAVKDGVVTHAGSGKSARFAELLPAAAKLKPPEKPTLRDPKTYTLVGSAQLRRKDSLAKSTGQARYTQDVYLPDMLTAVVAHSPRFGGKVKRFDATAARKVKGVVDVFAIPSGVAVVATGVHAARKGRDALKVEWDDANAEKRSSDEMLAAYRAMAKAGDTKWQAFESKGAAGDKSSGIENAFSGANTDKGAVTVHDAAEFAYDFPYLAHATMEPMNCVAQVDGNRCKLTFGSQVQTLDQINAALAVSSLPGAIEIETLYAGGSFGRRANPASDYAIEAVQIAKHVGHGRPVKLVWTREDDMTGGRYRPMAHHAIKVKTGADGYPAAWRHRIVVQSFMKGTPLMRGDLDETQVEGVKGSPYLKATPLVDAAVATPVSPVTTLWWRSVGATHTALAMEHTIDQLAARAKIDPVEYRRELYRRAGADRHLAVLNLAAEKAGWGQPLETGWARGVAVHESFGSVVANVAEVSLSDGEPKVRRVVAAIDCGFAVMPDQVAAQMEGGVCYGLSSALYGAITLKDGVVEQTNFDGYRVLRINEAPQVETYIVPSANHPTGVGEPGTPVVIPAVANALLVLTGKPTTSLPFVKA